jgi:hypothetical protein
MGEEDVDAWVAERQVRNEYCLFPALMTMFSLAAMGGILMAVKVFNGM